MENLIVSSVYQMNKDVVCFQEKLMPLQCIVCYCTNVHEEFAMNERKNIARLAELVNNDS